MGNNSSSGYGHSFLDFFHSIGDFAGAIGGMFQGDTSGWSKYANDMKTYGNDIAQTFTNSKYTRYNDPSTPANPYGTDTSRAKSASGGTIGSAPPPSAVTSNTRSAVNATYGGNLGGTIPPSNLQAISDPNAKMAIASSRGSQRQSLNINNASSDITSASAIATASVAPAQ